jgi:sensor histidine kinase YesM
MPNEKVLLKNEIKYVEDFILLQKLLSSDINVKFIVTGSISENIQILPRILVVFVENAFKHGNPYSSTNPIRIELNYLEGVLIFRVINEKNKKPIMEISGIGHHNLREHLELFYKDNYSLEISQDENIYCSNLRLNILQDRY